MVTCSISTTILIISRLSIVACLTTSEKTWWMKLSHAQQGKGILRFISTHPDEDHILGLKYLDGELGLLNFYCINNNAAKEDESDDFKHYCALRDSDKAFYIRRGITRKWMNIQSDERGSAGI